jgi:hypothetical protein
VNGEGKPGSRRGAPSVLLDVLRVRIDYDSVDHSVKVVAALPGAFKRTPEQPLPPTGAWERLRFSVRDAASTAE